jgi:hypothetical protein
MKNLLLHFYNFLGLNKIVFRDFGILKFLLKRPKYTSLLEYTL